MTSIALYPTSTNTIDYLITPIAILIIIAYVYGKLTHTKTETVDAAPIKHSPAPIKHSPAPVAFTCLCCNSTYSNRDVFGKEFNGKWFCDEKCNSAYNSRQMYTNQFALQSNNNFLSSNSALYPVFPVKVIPGRYSSDGIKFIF